MPQQVQRPVRRTGTQRVNDEVEDLWPSSAREFMKLPVSELLKTRTRWTFKRHTAPPDHTAS